MKRPPKEMTWRPVYIYGKNGFEAPILRQLGQSGFLHMPGVFEAKGLYLCWITENSSVYDFKRALGGKLTLKYRLRFFESFEAFTMATTMKSADRENKIS